MSHTKYRPDPETAKAGAREEARVTNPENFVDEVAERVKWHHKLLQGVTCSEMVEHDLDEEQAIAMLKEGTRFLYAVVKSVSAVLRTVPVNEMRRICGPIDGLGGRKWPEREDARKRPRGTTHPLMRMVSLAIQAHRLMERGFKILFPETFAKKGKGSKGLFSIPGFDELSSG